MLILVVAKIGSVRIMIQKKKETMSIFTDKLTRCCNPDIS